MAAVDSWQLANDVVFGQRLTVLYTRAAVALMGGGSSGNPDRDQKVRDLCVQIMQSPEGYVRRFAFAVVQDPAITAASTDDQVYTVIAAVFPYVAGWTSLG